MRLAESTAIHRLSHLKETPCCQERKSLSVSIRFTICHEHACAACPTHVCHYIWRKRVYVIANERFGLGTGHALLRSPGGRNASRDGLVKLGWVHCLQYTPNCFQYNVCGLCRCEPSNQRKNNVTNYDSYFL